MKKKRIVSILFIIVLLAAVLSSCNKDYTEGTPFEKKESQDQKPTSSPTNNTAADSSDVKTDASKVNPEKNSADNPDTSSGKDSLTPTPSVQEQNDSNTSKPDTDNHSNEAITGTDKANTDTDIDSNNTDVDTGTNIISTDTTDNGSSSESNEITDTDNDPQNTARDSYERQDYWESTFLIWLPMFTDGSFSGQSSAGTFDYATFMGVSADNVKNYIAVLKDSGFNKITEEDYSDSSISFIASNSQSWEVRIVLYDSTLTIGSGFEEGDSYEEDPAEKLFSTTMLQYMPHFTKGKYVSSEVSTDSTMYSSIFFSNVSEEDVLSYIEQTKSAGYIYAPEEGRADDSIWYMAINEERFECRIEFSGSDLKIGCGYVEDD